MPAFLDLKGNSFGRLKVLLRSSENIRNRPAWFCQCECGNKVLKASRDLVVGDSQSCGCLRKDLLRIDLLNKKFGRLTVISRDEKIGNSTSQFWLCECECGNTQTVSSAHLTLGQVTHCKKCPKKSEELLLKEAIERFNSSYVELNGCWNWMKTIVRHYGVIFYKKPMKANRFSFKIFKGDIEEGKLVCHTCDNPLCVNPDHLYQGTSRDNFNDMITRGRFKPRGKIQHLKSCK